MIWFQIAYDDGTEDLVFNPANETRVRFESAENVKNAILIIDSASLEDRGSYNCTVKSAANEFNAKKYPPFVTGTFVRVKGEFNSMNGFRTSICTLNPDTFFFDLNQQEN